MFTVLVGVNQGFVHIRRNWRMYPVVYPPDTCLTLNFHFFIEKPNVLRKTVYVFKFPLMSTGNLYTSGVNIITFKFSVILC